jgi:hypothetical protein
LSSGRVRRGGIQEDQRELIYLLFMGYGGRVGEDFESNTESSLGDPLSAAYGRKERATRRAKQIETLFNSVVAVLVI